MTMYTNTFRELMGSFLVLIASAHTVMSADRDFAVVGGIRLPIPFAEGRKCPELENRGHLQSLVARGWCHETSQSTVCEVSACLYICGTTSCQVTDLKSLGDGVEDGSGGRQLGTDYETFDVLVDYTDDTSTRSVDMVAKDLIANALTGPSVISNDDSSTLKSASGYRTRFRENVVVGSNDSFRVNIKGNDQNTINPRMRIDFGRRFNVPREFTFTFLHKDCNTPATINIMQDASYCETAWTSWSLNGSVTAGWDFIVEGTATAGASATFTACAGIEDPASSTGSDGYTTMTVKLGRDSDNPVDFGDYGVSSLAGESMAPSWMAYVIFEVVKDGC